MHRTDKYSQRSSKLNHLASLAKWLSVRLRTKWLWVRITLLSLKIQIWCLLRTRSFAIYILSCGIKKRKKLICLKVSFSNQIFQSDIVTPKLKYVNESCIIIKLIWTIFAYNQNQLILVLLKTTHKLY